MIHTNLSTRPFYNERLVHVVLAVLALAAIAVTALNVVSIVRLSGKDAALTTQTTRAESKAAESRRNAVRVMSGINPAQLGAVSAAASEANVLIDRRTFSWTQLLTDFEATLPPDVRISSVAPRVEKDGTLHIEILAVGRTPEDISSFVDKLEARGAFADVLLTQENVNTEGLLETTIVGRYVGGRRAQPAPSGAGK